LLSSEQFLNNSYFGKIQYNNIIRLRAIEIRKPIVKSSCFGENIFIDKNGVVKNFCLQEFCSFTINKEEIKSNTNTFYSEYITKGNIYLILNLLFVFRITINNFSRKLLNIRNL